MKSFKIDLHVHTSEVSSCGKISAAEVVNLYKEAGFDGIVITDHFYNGYFNEFKGLTWVAKIDHFLHGYQEAFRVGQEIGIQVILGMEIRFSDSPNDYLVYGIDEWFLKERPLLYDLNLAKFHQNAANSDLLVYQAHPFRPGITVADPAFLDGVEVFNGNRRHNSMNPLAYEFAQRNQLRMISGSDFHQKEDLARGGIVIKEKVNNSQELVAVLKENAALKLLGLEEIAG